MRASAESSHRPPFIVAQRRGAYVGGHHGISHTSSAGSGSSEGVEERKRRGIVARLPSVRGHCNRMKGIGWILHVGLTNYECIW